MANRLFTFGKRIASTLFGRSAAFARDDGTAPLSTPPRNPISPKPPYTPPFQLEDDPPPEATSRQRREEYAAAQVGLAAYYRSLPMWIDDLTRGLGDDLYARMGLDDQIFTSTRNVVRQVLADGLTIRSGIDDKDDPNYEKAKDYADRAERMLADLSAGLPQSMDAILQEALLIAAGMGHKVFELVYEPGDDGWTNLARIKSKPRRATAFVVNPYNDVVGVLARLPGMALPALASVTDLRSMPILPVDKFAILTHLQEDADPRGNSLWRAAYSQWWEKLQTAREYMKYLAQFAMPSLAGEMPEMNTEEPATDQFGNVQPTTQVSSAQAFVNQLVAFRNGSAIAHPHGAKIYTLFAASSGEAFWHKLDRCDRQIDKVITGQVLAGQEAEHGTRAQSETHQDTEGANLPYYRGLLEELLNRQILQRWLRLNEGDEAARTLCPKATLTKIEEQDRGSMMTSYGSLYSSGVLKPSQLPFVHEQLGLPPCQAEELTSPTDDALKLAQAKGGDEKGDDEKGDDAKGDDPSAPPGSGKPPPQPKGAPEGSATNDTATFADDSDGQWVTIGGGPSEEGEEHAGGTHVFIKGGRIIKGPAGMLGKKPSELKDHKITAVHGAKHPETQDRRGPILKGKDRGQRKRGSQRSGSGAVPTNAASGSGQAADATGRSGDRGAGESGQDTDKPAGQGTAARVPAAIEHVNRKLDRYANHFRAKGQYQVAEWMDKLKEHVNTVGVQDALESLGAEVGGEGENVQYAGFNLEGHANPHFVEAYLARNGITMTQGDFDPSQKVVSTVSPSSDEEGVHARGDKRDVFPKLQTLKHKLDEAQHLPGLETSEDLSKLMGGKTGAKVPSFTPQVIDKLNATYGEGQWIVKSYGDEAYAGYGIFFPQRVAALQQDARNTLWAAGGELQKYGFAHLRDKSGKVVGIKHAGGEEYKFGTKKYKDTIHGAAREWGDKSAVAAASEQGTAIPEGRFMAQPAFPVVGITNEERAKGVTFKRGQEGRVHIVTRDGKAEIVPHSTWLKEEPLPVVFEDDDTHAMAQAAVDAINALPKSERKGQLYAPDVVRTANGYKVVEANPANEAGASGYLQDNPLVIDSYVSHLTGREPAHVSFIRKLLTKNKGKGKSNSATFADDADGHWVTMEGAHVFIGKDGTIEKGPSHLRGKKLDELPHEVKKSIGPSDIGTQATRQEHAKVIALAKKKLANVTPPTEEEIAQAQAGIAKKGVNKYRKDLLGNVKDRKKRREKLLWEFDTGVSCPCVYCGVKIGEGTMEQDKILTTRQGGRYRVDNLLPACSHCNKSRGDKLFAEVIKGIKPHGQ